MSKHRFSPHDIRDVLQSTFEKPEIRMNPNLIKPLMSHKVGGVDGHYSSHTDDEYLTAFKLAVPYLVPTTEQLKAKIQEQKAETEKQQSEIETMKAEHQKQLEDTNKKLDDFMNYHQEKWQYEEDMNEVYFDYGYDSETDKQATDKEVENDPQACKAILETIEEHESLFKPETINQWKEYLLNPDKRKGMKLKIHWRMHSM